jgi:hypothetical protein
MDGQALAVLLARAASVVGTDVLRKIGHENIFRFSDSIQNLSVMVIHYQPAEFSDHMIRRVS